jgi:hypothetical protein
LELFLNLEQVRTQFWRWSMVMLYNSHRRTVGGPLYLWLLLLLLCTPQHLPLIPQHDCIHHAVLMNSSHFVLRFISFCTVS